MTTMTDELDWDGTRLRRARVSGGGDRWLEVDGAVHAHPLLGPAHRLTTSTGAVTWMGAVTWARPDRIPAVEHPALVPALAGTALLNLIARQARRAGVATLRYAGPYPTAALWSALAQCFTTTATEDDFTRDAERRAARVDASPVAVDFTPAPFERRWLHPRVAVQHRAALERVIVDDVAYVAGGGPHRLRVDGEVVRAELWIGDAPWAEVAVVTPDGGLLSGPTPTPAPSADVVGRALPPALTSALAELVVELVAAPLAAVVRAELARTPVVWGDAGARLAVDAGDRVLLHAALWERLAPHGLARVALALAEALAPVIARRAQAVALAALG
ncbi:MAG: hypothetical protein R2939_07050 [Kofleriaceae bacterium]